MGKSGSSSLLGIARLAAATVIVAGVAGGTTLAESAQSAIVARLPSGHPALTQSELTVRIGTTNFPVTAIRKSPDVPRSIAIVLDVGPDQTEVLFKEKEIAMALINELSDSRTSFTVVRAGTSAKVEETAVDRSLAIKGVSAMTADTGRKAGAPIYDAVGAAIHETSRSPGLRIVLFIGEGNDGGSTMSYPELRTLAEANHVAFFAALVASHSLRGTKSILRYGWNLRALAGETAGLFLENRKTTKATRTLGECMRALRLITFDMPSRPPGRYEIRVSATGGARLRAQRSIYVP